MFQFIYLLGVSIVLRTFVLFYFISLGEAKPPTIFVYHDEDKYSHDDYQFNDFVPIFNPTSDLSKRELAKVCDEDDPCMWVTMGGTLNSNNNKHNSNSAEIQFKQALMSFKYILDEQRKIY